MGRLFGNYIRNKRLALQENDPQFSIRGVAKRIGIHHSYLSKMERGEPATLSQKRLLALADVLGEDPDVVLAMNGKVSEQVSRNIIQHPQRFSHLLKAFKSSCTDESQGAGSFMNSLRSFQSMCVFLVDEDRHVYWSNNHPLLADTANGQRCHEALFRNSKPCEQCPMSRDDGSDNSYLADFERSSGDVWRVGAMIMPDLAGLGKKSALHVAVNLSDSAEIEKRRTDADRLFCHDIKSPLAGMVNLIRQLELSTSGDTHECLNLIARTGERLLTHVMDHEALVALESGTYAVVPTSFDLAAMVREIAQVSGPVIRALDGRLELLLNDNALKNNAEFMITGDERLVYRMLMNTIRNAVEASRPGDRVVVSLRDGDSAQVQIVNSQPVPMEMRDRFFDKYATYGKPTGIGLGTYGTKLMAEAMGGFVEMRTSAQDGTRVTIGLPRDPD